MKRMLTRILCTLPAALILAGCAQNNVRRLMPTPSLYVVPGGPPVFDPSAVAKLSPEIDLLYVTDREPQSVPGDLLPYGQERANSSAFGSVQIRVTPELSGEALAAQSRLDRRTHDLRLELGEVQELGRFPEEPYQLTGSPSGDIYRDERDLQTGKETQKHPIAFRILPSSIRNDSELPIASVDLCDEQKIGNKSRRTINVNV